MKRGFTLIEITVVLAIVGLIIGGGMVTLTAGVQQSAYNSTMTTMNAIDQALYNFANASGRLPCPSNPTLGPTSPYYGMEAGTSSPGAGVGYNNSTGSYQGECGNGVATPYSYYGGIGSATAEEGGVPTRALRLPDSYMYDGWGRRIRYAVDPNYTMGANANTTYGNTLAPIPNYLCSPDTRGITVYDGSGNKRSNASAAYVLVSHGSNGHGAYTMYGGANMFNVSDQNTDKLKNCSCNNTGASTGTYNNAYTQSAPYYSSGFSGNQKFYFDDIISYKEGWQMVNPSSVSASQLWCSNGAVVYIANGVGNSIQKWTVTGTYITQYTNSSNGGFSFLSGVFIDKSGNMWATDSNNARIVELNSSGTFVNAIGAGYNGVSASGNKGNGQFVGPSHMFIDGNNNIWVVDSGNHRVQEFNGTTLAWMAGLGIGGTGYTSVGTPGTAGTGNGQFTSPLVMAVDHLGNVWVTDQAGGTGSERVQKFSNTGTVTNPVWTYQQTVRNNFTKPTGIAVDSSNNIYVADWGSASSTTTEKVTKFSNAGAILGSFLLPNCYLNYGMTMDPTNNLWIAATNGTIRCTTAGECVWFGSMGTGVGQYEQAGSTGIAGAFYR